MSRKTHRIDLAARLSTSAPSSADILSQPRRSALPAPEVATTVLPVDADVAEAAPAASEHDTWGSAEPNIGILHEDDVPYVKAFFDKRAAQYVPSSVYSFRLRVPGRIAAQYVQPNRDIEEVMEERLTRCATMTSETPLTFTDDQRRQLLDLLGVATPEDVLRHIRNLVTFATSSEAAGTLKFSAQQLERVGFRCAAGETVNAKLQEYCDYGVNLQVGLT